MPPRPTIESEISQCLYQHDWEDGEVEQLAAYVRSKIKEVGEVIKDDTAGMVSSYTPKNTIIPAVDAAVQRAIGESPTSNREGI